MPVAEAEFALITHAQPVAFAQHLPVDCHAAARDVDVSKAVRVKLEPSRFVAIEESRINPRVLT